MDMKRKKERQIWIFRNKLSCFFSNRTSSRSRFIDPFLIASVACRLFLDTFLYSGATFASSPHRKPASRLSPDCGLSMDARFPAWVRFSRGETSETFWTLNHVLLLSIVVHTTRRCRFNRIKIARSTDREPLRRISSSAKRPKVRHEQG